MLKFRIISTTVTKSQLTPRKNWSHPSTAPIVTVVTAPTLCSAVKVWDATERIPAQKLLAVEEIHVLGKCNDAIIAESLTKKDNPHALVPDDFNHMGDVFGYAQSDPTIFDEIVAALNGAGYGLLPGLVIHPIDEYTVGLVFDTHFDTGTHILGERCVYSDITHMTDDKSARGFNAVIAIARAIILKVEQIM